MQQKKKEAVEMEQQRQDQLAKDHQQRLEDQRRGTKRPAGGLKSTFKYSTSDQLNVNKNDEQNDDDDLVEDKFTYVKNVRGKNPLSKNTKNFVMTSSFPQTICKVS